MNNRCGNWLIDNQSLATSDLAVVEDSLLYAKARREALHTFRDGTPFQQWWATRENFLNSGGRRISDLSPELQRKYRRDWA